MESHEELKKLPSEQENAVSLVDVVNVVADRAEPMMKIWTSIAEAKLKADTARAGFKKTMVWLVVAIVVVVIGTAGGLTYAGKLDGQSFTFLLGLVVGYMLSFIRDAIYPREE